MDALHPPDALVQFRPQPLYLGILGGAVGTGTLQGVHRSLGVGL
jgi:hypothetical protein